MHERRAARLPALLFVLTVSAAAGYAPALAQEHIRSGVGDPHVDPTEYRLAMNAKLLCSGVFVQGRSPELHVREDLRAFDHFGWGAEFRYAIDREAGTVTLRAPGVPARTARYNGDQGCAILPRGGAAVFFEPIPVAPDEPDPARVPWPDGDRLGDRGLEEAGAEALEAALAFALDDSQQPAPQNTRAIVVVHGGRIIGERYAEGWGPRTPQLSWSMGKSITGALVGVLVQQGELSLDQRAPIAAWSDPRDPRSGITIADLMRMSSGLDFNNWGIDRPYSMSIENSHFRIYFEATDVFEHAISRPLELEPGSTMRYRNSDPLTLGSIVRQVVERRGQSYHRFPWTDLFHRIGMRDVVLETDAWGNFILTGYDYASARDWARFGLLHLNDGVWRGERILPEGWSDWVATPAPGSANRGYGGLFWLNRGGAYPSIPEDAYWAAGFMGQTTMIIPSRNMVIVRLGPSAGRFNPYFDEVVRRILSAVE